MIMNALYVGLAVSGIVAVTAPLVMRLRRNRVRRKTRARKAAAGGAWGTGRVQDRRALWARRYGAGAAWTGVAVGLGMGGIDGVGDPHARCAGGAVGGGRGGGGVGCGAGGCGAGGT